MKHRCPYKQYLWTAPLYWIFDFQPPNIHSPALFHDFLLDQSIVFLPRRRSLFLSNPPPDETGVKFYRIQFLQTWPKRRTCPPGCCPPKRWTLILGFIPAWGIIQGMRIHWPRITRFACFCAANNNVGWDVQKIAAAVFWQFLPKTQSAIRSFSAL